MDTCVLYVDEAGSPHKHDVPLQAGQTPLFVLGGVALALDEWRNIDREYLNLKRKYFAAEMAAPGLARPEHWEAKGNDLTAPRNKESARRQAFTHELLNGLEQWDARVFAIVFIKEPSTAASSVGLYTSAVQQLADRFSIHLSEHHAFQHGIMIMDSRSRGREARQDFQVGSSYLSYVFGHDTGRLLTNLAEAPLFADSRLTAGLQIADNVASIVYANQFHYYLRKLPGGYDYSYLQQYWARIKSLEFRSKRTYDGYPVYGLRVNGDPALKRKYR